VRQSRWEAPNGGATNAEGESRKRLLSLSVGLVEDLRCTGPRHEPHEVFSPQFQVCFPYRGLFVWRVGRDDVVGDANQVVFVRGEEGSRIGGPLDGGYGELIITPRFDVIAEIAHTNGVPLSDHPLFRRRARRADPRLQLLRSRFLHQAAAARLRDDLHAEEAVLALLRAAVHDNGQPDPPRAAVTARLIRRTKEFLAAELSNRILLADVGRAVGASPAYLTDVFRRTEGASLHRYLVQLRLARALVELPHADDLTALAYDVGFSSHSHFSAAFRRAYGSTPSEFRRSSRRTASRQFSGPTRTPTLRRDFNGSLS
jgi:AraC-like DNA-binding protein